MTDPYEQAYSRVYQTPAPDQQANAPQAPEQATDQAMPTPDRQQPTPDQQQTQTPHTHKLDRQQITDKVNKEAGTEPSLSLGDYAWDGAVGVAAGVEGFAKSIGKLGNDVAGLFGAKFADDDAFENSIKTKTWVGGLTSGLTQFALAFLPAVGVAGRIGEAVGITSKLATSFAAGAAADFFGFSEKQQRLSNLVESFPILKNPVTEFLSSKPDDNWAEGRLKNALEGVGMGIALHPFFEAIKGFKGMLLAKTAGDAEGYAKAVKLTQARVVDAVDAMNGRAPAANAAASAADAAAGTGTLSGTAGKLGADYLRNGVPSELVDKIVDHIKTTDQPFEVALDDAVKTHLNLDRLVTSDDVEGLHKLALNVSEKYFQGVSGGTQALAIVENTANELSEIFGQNPRLMFSSVAADQKGIEGMGVRLVAYRIQRNAIGQSLVNASERYLAAGTGGTDELKRLTTLATAYMDLHNSVQFIQKEGARIPSYGRVVADSLVSGYDPDKLARVVQQTMNGSNGSMARQQLARTIVATQADPKSLVTLFDGMMKRTGPKAIGVLNEIHVNSILSSLSTMATKFLSDTMNAVVLPAERIMGGAWMQNSAVMKSGGRMYANIMSSFLDWTHLSEAATRVSDQYGSSVGRAYRAFLTGQPLLDHLSEFGTNGAISSKNFGMKQGSMLASAVDAIGNTVRLPQRFLIGMDEFWKSVSYKAYVRDEGMRLAEQAGITHPDQFAQFVNDHITKAFTEGGQAANDAALSYAKSATFQNDLLPGTMGKWIQQGVNDHPALRMILPFVKTPTNIFRRAWQMTPGLNLLQGEFRKMAMSADPIERATAYGRTTMGGMMWTLAIGMAATGRLTGGGPSKPEQRNGLVDEGWQPYSFVVTGADGKKQYIGFKKLEPFAYALGLAADWSEAVGTMHDDDSERMGVAMTYALAHNLSSKAYYNGLTELINALSQPDTKLQHFLNSFAGSWVPAAVAKADNDDYMREARTMMDAVTRRVPGLSENMPPARNILGEPVKVPQGWLPFGAEGTSLARQVSPFAFSRQVDDPVKKELAALQYPFRKAPQRFQGFDLSMFRNQQGQDAYDRLSELHGQVQMGGQTLGQALSGLVNSKRYALMPKPEMANDQTNRRVMAVESIISAYRGKAMQQILQEYPQIGRAIQTYQKQARGPATPSPVLPAMRQQ